jgi:hypothetical protein
MTLIARIKRYFARKKHKFKTKMHYSNPDICKIEIEYMDNVYKIWDNSLGKYLGACAIIMSEYMQGRRNDANTKECIDFYYNEMKDVQIKLKNHLKECSHKCRLFLFFTKKGCINEYYPEGFKVGLERYKVLSESKINYDPYLDFKQMKVEKKKKDIEKDFH